MKFCCCVVAFSSQPSGADRLPIRKVLSSMHAAKQRLQGERDLEIDWKSESNFFLMQEVQKGIQWISFFFYAKLWFYKWWSGRIDLKFSGVALLSQLYSPKWKRNFFYKERYLSQRQVMNLQCERDNTVGKRTVLPILWKKLEGLGNIPFRETIKQKWSEKLKMTFLNEFHHGGHPGTRPERVRCTSWSSLALTAPLPHVVTQKMIIALSSACAQSRRECVVGWARRVRPVELAAYGSDNDAARWRPAQLSNLPSMTGHTWRENAPESPKKKWG